MERKRTDVRRKRVFRLALCSIFDPEDPQVMVFVHADAEPTGKKWMRGDQGVFMVYLQLFSKGNKSDGIAGVKERNRVPVGHEVDQAVAGNLAGNGLFNSVERPCGCGNEFFFLKGIKRSSTGGTMDPCVSSFSAPGKKPFVEFLPSVKVSKSFEEMVLHILDSAFHLPLGTGPVWPAQPGIEGASVDVWEEFRSSRSTAEM